MIPTRLAALALAALLAVSAVGKATAALETTFLYVTNWAQVRE
jgi:hypothetical protein